MTDPPTDTGTLYATNLVGTPGATLREAREKAGFSLDEMAVQTKIPLPVLQAIEHDDTAQLGQPVYVRGYLRRYARALNVAEAKVLTEFDSRPAARAPASEPPPAAVESTEADAGGRPLLWILVIVIVTAIAGAAVLYFRGGSLTTLTRRPPPRPVAVQQRAPVAQPAPAPVAEPAAEPEAPPAAETLPPQAKPAAASHTSGNPAVPGGPPPVNQPEPGSVSPTPQP